MRTDMYLRQRHPGILLLCLLASLAACQPAETVGSPEKGKRVALQWCAECHLVSSDQETIPDRGAPSFREIAKEQGNVLAYMITQGYDH